MFDIFFTENCCLANNTVHKYTVKEQYAPQISDSNYFSLEDKQNRELKILLDHLIRNYRIQEIASNHLSTMSSDELNQNWKLNEFFENIMVINLPHALKRLEDITKNLKAIGTKKFKIFKAIHGRTEIDESI